MIFWSNKQHKVEPKLTQPYLLNLKIRFVLLYIHVEPVTSW